MTMELAPTATLIPRWLGHGDLTIVLINTRVFVRADQVEQLAGIPPWSGGETLLGDTWPLELDGKPYYELDDAIARCEAAATDQAAAFLEWLRDSLTELLDDDVLDLAQRAPAFIGSYPVRVAAKMLDADPAISIGQNSLFAHMQAQGWITREDGADWTIAHPARRNGWLTTRQVTIPAANRDHRRTYPQIYVTPAGLDQLRTTLHALHPAPAAAHHPTPTLFD